MYAGIGFKTGVIGDVDVIKVGNTFHLFHLVLPNHSYIAHAISTDGLAWQAAPHALHISDPGHFDDDMLWTMHVTPDPDSPPPPPPEAAPEAGVGNRESGTGNRGEGVADVSSDVGSRLPVAASGGGQWRMFYTGLNRDDHNRIQRVGLAVSSDLYHWTKLNHTAGRSNGQPYPIEPTAEFYEADRPDNRLWRSFRDPYFYRDPRTGRRLLLACGRVNHGPMVRRGCVVTAEEVGRDEWAFIKPLHHPGVYDEVECPAVFDMDGRYYLLGSIREDTKVRYWFADRVEGPYENFFDNTLLPQGNYAARPGRDGDQWLLWNFFYQGTVGGPKQYLSPPKLLAVDRTGRLRLKTYPGFDKKVIRTLDGADLSPLEPLRDNPEASKPPTDADGWLGSHSGFEAFFLQGSYEDARLRATLRMDGRGKAGLVFRMDDQGNGYYFSLDLTKGMAQARAWGENPEATPGVCCPECGAQNNPLDPTGTLAATPGPRMPEPRTPEPGPRTLPPEQGFIFETMQASHFLIKPDGPWEVQLIGYGRYMELSINGYIVLTFANDRYAHGRMGFYVEGARLRIDHVSVDLLSQAPGDDRPVALV